MDAVREQGAEGPPKCPRTGLTIKELRNLRYLDLHHMKKIKLRMLRLSPELARLKGTEPCKFVHPLLDDEELFG